MKNLRELFTEYHNGFQNYGPWLDHHREMHRRHPLDCAEFGAEWLRRWEAVGRLLKARCYIQHYCGNSGWRWSKTWKRGRALSETIAMLRPRKRIRIVLLGGTVIREWSALTMGERIRSGLEETLVLKTLSPYIHHQFSVGK